MIVLGIETSCDETSAALVKDGRDILSHITASSLRQHKKYQGIIPEIASRAHIESISLVARQAFKEAQKEPRDIGLICVTQGPGLLGSLLVGVSFAKALSFALKKPLLGVDHLQAHLYSSFLSSSPSLPCIGLVASGGHTSLYRVDKNFNFRLLSATIDDAVGEAFDKVAKILGLGYPGGPVIEKLAKKGNPDKVKLSCAGPGDLGFSFSGIKTAVLYKVTRPPPTLSDASVGTGRSGQAGQKVRSQDLAASFQKAVAGVLVDKALRACEREKINTLVIGGGVSANNFLRMRFVQEARLREVKAFFPDFSLSLDNAAMIAGLGYQLYRKGKRSGYYLTPFPS